MNLLMRASAFMFALALICGCASPPHISNYYREMFGASARPAVEKVFGGASYIYRNDTDLILMTKGGCPTNFRQYSLVSGGWSPVSDEYSRIADLQKVGSPYDNPLLPVVDMSEPSAGWRNWRSVQAHYGKPYLEWTSQAGPSRATFPEGTRWSGHAAFYTDYFVVGVMGEVETWRKAGVQVYDTSTGEMLWQDLVSRHSSGWSFHGKLFFHVSTAAKGGFLECIELATGKKKWSLSISPSSGWLASDPGLGDRQSDLPHLGGYVQGTITPKGWLRGHRWIVSAQDGHVVCTALDGKRRWVAKVPCGIHSPIPEVHMVAADPNWLHLRHLVATASHIWLVGQSGKLHLLDMSSGNEVAAFSSERRVLAPPVFFDQQAFIITETSIVRVSEREMRGRSEKTIMAAQSPALYREPAPRVFDE